MSEPIRNDRPILEAAQVVKTRPDPMAVTTAGTLGAAVVGLLLACRCWAVERLWWPAHVRACVHTRVRAWVWGACARPLGRWRALLGLQVRAPATHHAEPVDATS